MVYADGFTDLLPSIDHHKLVLVDTLQKVFDPELCLKPEKCVSILGSMMVRKWI